MTYGEHRASIGYGIRFGVWGRGFAPGLQGCFLLSITLSVLMLLFADGRVYTFAGMLIIAVALAVICGQWRTGWPQELDSTDVRHIQYSLWSVVWGLR